VTISADPLSEIELFTFVSVAIFANERAGTDCVVNEQSTVVYTGSKLRTIGALIHKLLSTSDFSLALY
jgi:hypothetical protein